MQQCYFVFWIILPFHWGQTYTAQIYFDQLWLRLSKIIDFNRINHRSYL